MEDKKLEALQLAQHLWSKSYDDSLKPVDRISMAMELHKYGMFSLNQLSKIVRISTVTLTRSRLESNSTGGRFEPETLTSLIAMRRSKLKGERVPVKLIEICVEGGTSWSCAAKLTGISYSNYYKHVPSKYAEEVRQLRLKTRDKDAINKALVAGADADVLGEQYNVSGDYVREIGKAYGNI